MGYLGKNSVNSIAAHALVHPIARSSAATHLNLWKNKPAMIDFNPLRNYTVEINIEMYMHAYIFLNNPASQQVKLSKAQLQAFTPDRAILILIQNGKVLPD